MYVHGFYVVYSDMAFFKDLPDTVAQFTVTVFNFTDFQQATVLHYYWQEVHAKSVARWSGRIPWKRVRLTHSGDNWQVTEPQEPALQHHPAILTRLPWRT